MESIETNHIHCDERNLALHHLIAQMQATPALLDKARQALCRWRENRVNASLAEQEQMLNGSVDQVAAFLVEHSEKANRLRQSSPLNAILTEAERRAVYDSYSTQIDHPPKDFKTLYHQAFRDYGASALWSSQPAPNPTREDALAITRSLRVEGDRGARRLAEQIEKACRAGGRRG